VDFCFFIRISLFIKSSKKEEELFKKAIKKWFNGKRGFFKKSEGRPIYIYTHEKKEDKKDQKNLKFLFMFLQRTERESKYNSKGVPSHYT
jgi:hypothetical protein